MKNSIIGIRENQYWKNEHNPLFTIITPLYNRRNTIERTMKSVQAQSFLDYEYIIIDDGSTETSDDIVHNFMDSVSFPMLYISKINGGVHTARNVGYRFARGELVICIDSDDELLPDACRIFYDAWVSIPEYEKQKYWQMKALCINTEGKVISSYFPENINEMTKEEAFKYFSLSTGEQMGCRVLSIMKKNLFPEPDYVKFVNECVIWTKLEQEYRSYGINVPVWI